MMLVAGVGLLIWMLMRRSHKLRKNQRRDTNDLAIQRKKFDARENSGAPLADAPMEVLRWQAAMFDLQRDLKAELECKISVVQAMVRLADDRIATMSAAGLAPRGPLASQGTAPMALRAAAVAPQPTPLVQQIAEIEQRTQQGKTAAEIASELQIPLGDVELLQSWARRG
jgi:hypothetical protein